MPGRERERQQVAAAVIGQQRQRPPRERLVVEAEGRMDRVCDPKLASAPQRTHGSGSLASSRSSAPIREPLTVEIAPASNADSSSARVCGSISNSSLDA